MNWVNVAVQGILLGGLYALFAIGLALVFGVMRLVNLAHGDLGILAAFIALGFVRSGVSLPVAALLSIVIMVAVGYVLQRGLLNFTLGTDDTRPIVVTFGLAIIIQNALLLKFSADEQGLNAGGLETSSIHVSKQVAVGLYPLLVFVLAVVLIAGVQLLLNRTKMGRAFRATSDDREAAELMGMNNRHIYALAMALSLGTVAIGGLALAVRTTFDPTAGSFNLIYAFEAVIMGGMGSLWGTLLGGVVLGLAQTLGAQAFGSGWGILCGNVVFLVVLAFRPSGFFARTVTA